MHATCQNTYKVSSYIAASTPFGAAEFENPPSSATPSATLSAPRVPPAAANEDEAVDAAEHQNAPQSFGHRGGVTMKPSHKPRAASHHDHRRYFTPQEAQGERPKRPQHRQWTNPAPAKRATREPEPEPQRSSLRTGGPFELLPGLTGPKGRRLARRLVRKRRTTTTAVSREPSATSTDSTGDERPEVSNHDQDAREQDESHKLAEHVWEIIARTPIVPPGRTEGARRTSLTPTLSGRQSPKRLRNPEELGSVAENTTAYIVPTNESCYNSSRCRSSSHDSGGGSREARGSDVMEPAAATLLRSPEPFFDSTGTGKSSRKAGIDGEPTQTVEAYTTTADLLDWLFAHGINNMWSGKVPSESEHGAQPRVSEDTQTTHSVNTEAHTGDRTPQHLPVAMTSGVESLTDIASPESARSSPDRFVRVSERLFDTKTACTPPDVHSAVNTFDVESFRKFPNRAAAGESASSNEDHISIPHSRLYLSDMASTFTLSDGLSSSLTPPAALSRSKESFKKPGVAEPAENAVPRPNSPSSHEFPLEANNETHANDGKLSGFTGEPLSLSTKPESGNENADLNSGGAIDLGGNESDDGDDDDSEDDDDDDDGDADNTSGNSSKKDAWPRSGLFHSFTRSQGILSGTPRRNYRNDDKNVAGFNRPFAATFEKEAKVEAHMPTPGNEGSAAIDKSSEPSPKLEDVLREHDVDSNVKNGTLEPTTILAEVTRIVDLHSVPPASINLSGQSSTDGQVEITSATSGQTATGESAEASYDTAQPSSADLNSSPEQSDDRDRQLRSGSSPEAAMTQGTTVQSEREPVPELKAKAENFKPSTVSEVASTTVTETVGTTFSDGIENTTQKGSERDAHFTSSSYSGSMNHSLSSLSESENISVVPASSRTEQTEKTSSEASTRRRKFETTRHDTAPDIVDLTSPTGTISYKALDAFLALKAQQMGRRFKIVGLMTWRNIEQFRLVNPSSDSFVEKVERLLLRINFDGLCMDLAGVTRGNILAYRHILRDMRVKLMDTKFLCSLFDYNVLYKASFQDLLSLLR
ncbi:hypothetical protein V5799_007719 [Amblyomma americanum]|uniref:Uncharacterized protein n=1 Tax=Amblyomma americanum TaxID=6943 RepID=A0AAQ4FGS6_AMBAM